MSAAAVTAASVADALRADSNFMISPNESMNRFGLPVPIGPVTPDVMRCTLQVASGHGAWLLPARRPFIRTNRSHAHGGHSSAAMTLDVYADLFDDDLDAVADALDNAVSRSGVVRMLSRRVP